MSHARKCDRCGDLFEATIGCVSAEINVTTEISKDKSPIERGWSEIDLCLECSGPIIAHLTPACDELQGTLEEAKRKAAEGSE